ncbi:MAG: DUF4350 domain-containing protein, partial [Isosphaeraceae bacterium]|nr:DUF4350 domain-containing protein [Isosphaeraceae bacterium]
MRRNALLALGTVWLLAGPNGAFAQQVADPDFDAKVARPAYADQGPTVLIDEAHNNFHTAGERYKPFADLVANDGYRVVRNRKAFAPGTLGGADALVVANALGAPRMNDPEATKPAFTAAECDAVRDWVRAGGALLLVTDHHPLCEASEALGARFGVGFGKFATFDPPNREPGYSPATLVFARHNELLGEHPILRGRDESEQIDRVVTFAGQSLSGPPGSTLLLKLSETAVDRPVPGQAGEPKPAAGRAQGLALTFGKGRVVVLGEAGMLSAQLNGPQQRPMGMNLPGSDNRQLALNIMHWLSALPAGKPAGLAAKPAPGPA